MCKTSDNKMIVLQCFR